MASAALELLIQLKDEASAGLSAITGSLSGVGNAALAVAGGGLLAIGGGLTAAIGAGLSFNNSMEQVSAQLMAFTKDGAQTAAILDMIKERAASTPFAFEDMATAATALLPASKAAGVGLEELIAQAEILAASNPAEGLEGAAFALKEAAGGDFASAIERFNLPRQYINQLKEEGVPNLEILSRAMGQLGLDADLVSGLANTASGRWSTFLDTMTNVAATVSQPIFEAFSSGLAGVQTMIDANMPAITAFAEVLSGQVASAIQTVAATLADWSQSFDEGGISGLLNNIIYSLTGIPMAAGPVVAAFESIGATLSDWMQSFSEGGISGLLNNLIYSLTGIPMAAGPVIAAFQSVLAAVQPLLPSLGDVLMPILVGLAAVIGGGIVAALGSMIATMVAAAAPIVALVAAVAALYAAWSNNWLGIQDITAAAWATISPYLTQLVDWLQTNIPIAIAAAAQLWTGTLWPALQSVGAFIVDTLIPAFMTIVDWLATNIPIAIAAAAQLWTGTLWPALQSVGAFIVDTLIPAFMTIVDWLATNIPVAVEAAVVAFQYVATTAGAVWGGIVATITTVGGAIATAIDVIVTIVTAAWNTIAFVTSAVWSAIADVIGPPLATAGAAVSSAVATIQSAIETAWNAIVSATEPIWSTVQTAVETAINAVSSVVSSVVATVQSVITGAWSTIDSETSGTWPQIQSIIEGVTGAIQTAVETATAIVKTTITTAWAVIKSASENDFGKIPDIIKGAWEDIKGAFNTGVDDVKKIFKGLADDAISLGSDVIDGVVKGVKNAAGKLKETLTGMANEALNAAKSALGIASPSKVMAAEVGAPIVDGIVAGLVQRSPKAVQAMLDLAGSMFDVVAKGVEAFGKLRELGNVPQSAILNFSDAIQRTLTEFANRVGQWDKAAMSAASQFTFKAGQVVDFLAKGVELLNGIAALAVPSRDAIRAFADALAMVMSEIVRVSTFELRLGLTAGVEFASGAKAIAEMIGAGVEALNALSDFVKPAPGVIQKFVDTIGWLVSRFVLVGQWFDGQALGAAQVFAQAAGQVFAVVSAGVDALIRLGEFVKPAPGVIQSFATTIWWLVAKFAEVGGWMSGPALTAATTFADAAGKVLGVIAAGVDGLLKLGAFVRPAPGAIQEFTTVIWWLVSRFAEAAGWMTGRALAEAVRFADGAGKVVGIIGAAVDALGKLVTFVAPAEANVSAFLRSMADLLEKMGSMAYYFEQDMLEATAALAEGISKSVAGIGAGVDLLSKLVNFVAPAEANVSAFLRGMADLLEKMGSMAYYFEQDMLEATGALAAGIAKSVAGLGAAVDVLGKLVTFVAPAEANVSAFLRGLADLLEKMGSMAYYFEQDMLAVTGALAEGIGKSVAGLGTAVDALSKLVDFVAPAEANVSAFFRSLADLLEKMGTWSANFEADMLEATGAFAAGIQKSVAGIGAAADALGKLVDFAAPAEKNVSAFFRALADLLEKMGVWSANFETDMLEATAVFANSVNSSIAPLKGAIESLGKFVDFVPPAQKGVSAFFQSVGALLTQMGTLAGQYSAEFFAGTITFGQNISKAVATVKAAFDEFASLADLKGLGQGVLTSFTTNLAALLDELAAQMVPAAENIGAALVFGIADGITAQLPYLVATLQNAAFTMVDTVQTALGIASPSKVFEQIGQYAGEGMAGGMAAMQPAIAGAGAGLGMAAAGGASGAASAGRGGGGEGLTVNIAAGAITLSGVSGQVGEKELRRLAQLIKEEFANERGGR